MKEQWKIWAWLAGSLALVSLVAAAMPGPSKGIDGRDGLALAPASRSQGNPTAQLTATVSAPKAFGDSKVTAATPEPGGRNGAPADLKIVPADPSVEGLAAMRKVTTTLQQTPYRIVYDVSGNDPGTGKVSGTFTAAAKGDRARLGIDGQVGGSQGSFILIKDGATAFLCLDGQGQNACLKTRTDTASSALPLPAVFSLTDLMAQISSNTRATFQEVPGKQIAGYVARCWQLTADNVRGTVCTAEQDGILLLLDGQFNGSNIKLQAREYSNAPDDHEFDAPFPVTELPIH